MSRLFGWSLPPGCGTLPGEEPEPQPLRCSHCGGFLKQSADSIERREFVSTDYGPAQPQNLEHILSIEPIEPPPFDDGATWYEWTFQDYEMIRHHLCARCGHDNRVGDW